MPKMGAGGQGGGIFGWDGSNWQRLQVDASYYLKCILQAGTAVIGKLAANSGVDIGDVDVLTINAAAPQFDDTDKLAVSTYGKSSAAGDTAVVVSAAGRMRTAHGSYAAGTDGVANNLMRYITESDGAEFLRGVSLFAFNGTTWDRLRNNAEITLLASAARTATTNSSDQTNYGWRGLVLFVDVTARAAATTLTPGLQVKDPVGGSYVTIWTAAAAINSGDTTVAYLFYPSPLADGAELYTEAVDISISRTWRLVMTHSDANSITYSAAASMIL